MKYRIICLKRHSHSGRDYLKLENANFAWLHTRDFDCWDDCELLASTFTEFEAAILLMTFRAHDVHGLFEYEAIEE